MGVTFDGSGNPAPGVGEVGKDPGTSGNAGNPVIPPDRSGEIKVVSGDGSIIDPFLGLDQFGRPYGGSTRSQYAPYDEGSGHTKWDEFWATLQQNQAKEAAAVAQQQADLQEKIREYNQTNLTDQQKQALAKEIQEGTLQLDNQKFGYQQQHDAATLAFDRQKQAGTEVDNLRSDLMKQTGPQDVFRNMFNMAGYQAPRGYAARQLPLTDAQRAAMGLAPGQDYVPGGNQDNPNAFLGNLPPSLQGAQGLQQMDQFRPTGGAGYSQQDLPNFGNPMQRTGGVPPGYGQQYQPGNPLDTYLNTYGTGAPGSPGGGPQGNPLSLQVHTGPVTGETGDFSWMWHDPSNPQSGWNFGKPPDGGNFQWAETPAALRGAEQAGGTTGAWGGGSVDPNGWLAQNHYGNGLNQPGLTDYPPGVSSTIYNYGPYRTGPTDGNIQYNYGPGNNSPGMGGGGGWQSPVGQKQPFQFGYGAQPGAQPGVDYSNNGQPIGPAQPAPFHVGTPSPNEASNPNPFHVGTPVGTPNQAPPQIGFGGPAPQPRPQIGAGAMGPMGGALGVPDFSKVQNLPPFLQPLANQTANGPQFVKPSVQQWHQMNNSQQGAYTSALGDLSGINPKDQIDKIPDQLQGNGAPAPTKFS